METSDWLKVNHSMREGWRFAGMRPGAPCVMEGGQLMMLKWLADSWDFHDSVSSEL